MKALAAILLSVIVIGCAKTPLTTPSAGAMQGGISRVQANATTAEQQRQEIERLNREARIKQARIDNKDRFLDAYRKWKAGQKP